jgi:hypothetical protein
VGIRSDSLSVELRFGMADGIDPFTEQVVAFLAGLLRS